MDKEPRYTARNTSFPYSPVVSADATKSVREAMGLSQIVFAMFLNVSTTTVKKWETGRRRPGGAAIRLLSEMQRDPEYWRKRFRQMVNVTKATQST